MTCPKCNSDRAVKNGKSRGKQRWLCQGCGKTYTENPDPNHGGGRKPCKWPGETQAERDRARMRAKAKSQKGVMHDDVTRVSELPNRNATQKLEE